MRRILPLFLIVACGGNPIDSAGNCTELLQATVAAGKELPDGNFTGTLDERAAALKDFDEQWNALQERVEAKAQPMIAAAIERGAEMEALLCAEAINKARGPIAQIFENIAGQLDTTTAP